MGSTLKGRLAQKEKEKEKNIEKTKGKSYFAAFMSLQSPSSIKGLCSLLWVCHHFFFFLSTLGDMNWKTLSGLRHTP